MESTRCATSRRRQYDVQVLRVGYLPQKKQVTVAAGETRALDFELTAAVVQLQEVVTTATGQQRRTELGNAVSTLGDVSTKVEQAHVTNLTELMTAKSPGVIVLPQSSLGGAPTFRIRGVSSISLTNAPIFYVDGVRYSAGDLRRARILGSRCSISSTRRRSKTSRSSRARRRRRCTERMRRTASSSSRPRRAAPAERGGTGRPSRRTSDDRAYQDMYANFGSQPVTDTDKLSSRGQLPTMSATTCISDSLTHYNWMKDPDEHVRAISARAGCTGHISGGNDAVRFFVSGDLDNEIGPIQMPGYEVQRFDSQNTPVRDEWFHPSAQQRSSFRGNLSGALSRVRPRISTPGSASSTIAFRRERPDHRALLRRHAELRLQRRRQLPDHVQRVARADWLPGKVLTDNDLTPLHDAYSGHHAVIQQTNCPVCSASPQVRTATGVRSLDAERWNGRRRSRGGRLSSAVPTQRVPATAPPRERASSPTTCALAQLLGEDLQHLDVCVRGRG